MKQYDKHNGGEDLAATSLDGGATATAVASEANGATVPVYFHEDPKVARIRSLMASAGSLDPAKVEIVDEGERIDRNALPPECVNHPDFDFCWAGMPISPGSEEVMDAAIQEYGRTLCNRNNPSPEFWKTVGQPGSRFQFSPIHGGIEHKGQLLMVTTCKRHKMNLERAWDKTYEGQMKQLRDSGQLKPEAVQPGRSEEFVLGKTPK